MALKFLYITTDPFVNNSQEFVRILAIASFPTAPSASGGATSAGNLFDENGNPVGYFELVAGDFYTSSTAYPYAFSSGWSTDQIILVAPGWKFSGFIRAIAVQGSLEEVLMVR